MYFLIKDLKLKYDMRLELAADKHGHEIADKFTDNKSKAAQTIELFGGAKPPIATAKLTWGAPKDKTGALTHRSGEHLGKVAGSWGLVAA